MWCKTKKIFLTILKFSYIICLLIGKICKENLIVKLNKMLTKNKLHPKFWTQTRLEVQFKE